MQYELVALIAMLTSVIGTPGPNNIVLFASGLGRGYRRTLPLLLAINAGVTGIVFAAYLGASYLSKWIPVIEEYLVWVAFTFLIYMAYSMWPKNETVATEKRDEVTLPALNMFFFQVFNPKIWVIALGVISTFHATVDLLTICIVTLIVGIVLNSLWVIMGGIANSISDTSERNISKTGSLLMLLTAVYFFVY
ncbi:LysE family translocator [Aliamphritea hakodatensis]|uniref:LysE family translocator n=1 Tax=Aliamphritea hakodatensis TaxID=2895352 RepID=UPI0022FD77B4|nr:LysE family transporter [Aliamphritea hakodatensis]